MARRTIIEDDVRTTPTVDSTTYVDDDASWAGRTIALIVLVALLIVGAIWLVNNVGDGDDGTVNVPTNEAPVDPGADTNTDTGDTNTDTGTGTDPGTDTGDTPMVPGG